MTFADNHDVTRLASILTKDVYKRQPHCTRHTCISMLSEAGVQDATIKKIVGHSGAMTLTEKVYTYR